MNPSPIAQFNTGIVQLAKETVPSFLSEAALLTTVEAFRKSLQVL